MLAHQIPVILGGGFDPSVIFAEMPGAWLEPRIGSMWQENTGATPTTAAGQSIGKINDLSGYGYNATQATVANRPTLQYTNGLPLVRCDSNDFMTVGLAAINVRRNLLTYSEQLNVAPWSADTGSSVTPNAALAPDGTTTADLLIATATSGVHRLLYNSLFSFSAGTYVGSIYAKPGGYEWLDLDLYWGGQHHHSYINVNTGQIGTVPSGISLSSVIDKNGYRRVFAVATVASPVTDFGFIPHVCNANNTLNFLGDGVSGLYLWGAQLELGSVATDYQKITDWTSEQFSSSGSVYFALNTGMSALHNQSIGTSYSAPIQSMDLYKAFIVPERLSIQREAQLQDYIERSVGLR